MKDDRVYLLHLRDALERVVEYTSEGRAHFLGDSKTQDAVARNLQIMGDAVKRVSEATTSRYPEVPWRQIAGMRDKMTHDYFGVDWQLVWEVVDREVPALKKQILEILDELS